MDDKIVGNMTDTVITSNRHPDKTDLYNSQFDIDVDLDHLDLNGLELDNLDLDNLDLDGLDLDDLAGDGINSLSVEQNSQGLNISEKNPDLEQTSTSTTEIGNELNSKFYLKLFGSPRLYYMNQHVKLGTRKAMALLCYLALRQTPVQRHELDTLLWPEKDEKRARRSLRDEISRINRTIGEDVIISSGQELSLTKDISVDVWKFSQGTEQLTNFQDVNIDYFEKVLRLYDGHLLSGFHIQNAQPFEEWLELERENCQHNYLEALLSLSHGAKSFGNYRTAINYMQKAIEVSPYTEEYYLYAIEYALLNGDRVKAQKLHQAIELLLQREFSEGTSENFKTRIASLGLATSGLATSGLTTSGLATSERHSGILSQTPIQQSVTPLLQDSYTQTENEASKHNLFEDALPFIGREDELRHLDNLIWENDCKLITLVGLGGIGKTRLAKQAASLSQANFPDGIWFIPIEKLDDPQDLFSVIADCLSLSLESTSAYTACMNHLKAKRMLLIFDNLSNNPIITKHIKTILRLNPGKVLVTSTQHLGLKEEWIFDVRGLSLPSNHLPNFDSSSLDNPTSIDAEKTFAQLKRLDAIQLFIESAKQTQPNFEFSLENAKDVVTICEATDGIPLGLQLATRRLRTLTCEELADEIRQGSDVLRTTFWDVPDNQRSLKAVFKSAFDSLRSPEKELYKKLADFEGSFDRYEAKELTGASTLDLAHFVERSLLIKDAAGSYQMLNFVRRYINDL